MASSKLFTQAPPCNLAVVGPQLGRPQHTMRFGRIAKVLAECKLKYYRISECSFQKSSSPWNIGDA